MGGEGLKPGVQFYDVRGEVEIDFHVRPLESEEEFTGTQLTKKLEGGTVVLSGAKVQSFTPPFVQACAKSICIALEAPCEP
jgi:hypothetical protein